MIEHAEDEFAELEPEPEPDLRAQPVPSQPVPEQGTILAERHRDYPTSNYPYYVRITTVLIAGAVGDSAAYTAATNEPRWAASNGDKLAFEEAEFLFPGIEKGHYRD